MDHALFVSLVDDVRDAGEKSNQPLPVSACLDQILERRPFDQLHRVVEAPVREQSQIVNGHDPRVIDPAHRSGLVLEPGGPLGIGETRGQDFHRDGPIEADVPGEEDLAHASTG